MYRRLAISQLVINKMFLGRVILFVNIWIDLCTGAIIYQNKADVLPWTADIDNFLDVKASDSEEYFKIFAILPINKMYYMSTFSVFAEAPNFHGCIDIILNRKYRSLEISCHFNTISSNYLYKSVGGFYLIDLKVNFNESLVIQNDVMPYNVISYSEGNHLVISTCQKNGLGDIIDVGAHIFINNSLTIPEKLTIFYKITQDFDLDPMSLIFPNLIIDEQKCKCNQLIDNLLARNKYIENGMTKRIVKKMNYSIFEHFSILLSICLATLVLFSLMSCLWDYVKTSK